MEEREDQIDYRIKIQGDIINKTIIIENLINVIILAFFKPHNHTIFISHILNSSVMHYGGKLKVLYGVIDNSPNIKYNKSEFENLKKLSSIRNSFAHTNIEDEYDVHFNNIEDDPFWIIKDSIEIMNSSGKVSIKDPKNVYKDFQDTFIKGRKFLDNIKSEILKNKVK